MTPIETVQLTSPLINAAGAAFYFNPDTLAQGEELGFDGFRFYFLGRGGVLGDVEPAVVASAFGYFNTGMVATMWEAGKEIMPPREAAKTYLECAAKFGRGALGDASGLSQFNDAAEKLINSIDVSGLALFAGIAAEPLPDDAPGRAYRNICTLRELRGSVHLLAVVASGLVPAVAHTIRRPEMAAAFGWDPAPEISERDSIALDAAEDLTDQLMASMFEVFSSDEGEAFAAGVSTISELTT